MFLFNSCATGLKTQTKDTHENRFSCTKKNTVSYTIATGPKAFTYFKFGNDLSKYVAKDACIKLTALKSNGSIDNVKRLAKESGMKLAIAQSDVFAKFKYMAKNGNRNAKKFIKQLRVIKSLHFEEAHFIVRASSKANKIQDIKNLRINVGPSGSGTSMTAINTYREMFGKNIPTDNLFTFGYKEALKRLLGNDLDVVLMVSGQPIGRLDMPKNVKNKIKLLEYDPNNSIKVSSYSQSKINKESYKWLDHDVNTLSPQAYLITFNYKGSSRKPLARFAKVLHENFSTLRAKGHPKWKSINEDLTKLPGGWKYYDPSKFAYKYKFTSNCNGKAKNLGLCK